MNFIFLSAGVRDYSDMMHHDIKKLPNVQFIEPNFRGSGRIARSITRIYFSPRLYGYIKLPFQNKMYKSLLDSFAYERELCIVMGVGWYKPDLVSYIREQMPNAKIVLYLTDTLDSKKKIISFLDGNRAKKDFDLVLSYNPDDVAKYGYTLTPVFYSKHPNYDMLPCETEYDFLYIGAARERLEDINKMYRMLTQMGRKCFFYVVYSREVIEREPGVIYSRMKLPYEQYLGLLKKSKCLIEILNPNTKGNTLRYWEAILYNKALITNLPNLKNQILYNSKYMYHISDVNCSMVDELLNISDIDYHYNGEISPCKLLEKIEKSIK